MQTSAIMDLLLTLVRVEELSEGKGIVQVNHVCVMGAAQRNKKALKHLNDAVVE